MSGTGIKGGVVLPKVQPPITCSLWWNAAPKWQDGLEPLIGLRQYWFTVTLSFYGARRRLVDRIEIAEPLPTMSREDWKRLCTLLHHKLETLTGFTIGVITNGLFMELNDGLVK